MATTLQDTTLERNPASPHAFPELKNEVDLRARPTLAEDLQAEFMAGGAVATSETSFEIASRGGYARTVTGTIAYLDAEAETFMVGAPDGELIRVPLRDVRSARQGVARSEH
jgi:hypothetical protein